MAREDPRGQITALSGSSDDGQAGIGARPETRKKWRLGHSGNSCQRRRAERKDDVWTWDFIHDRTATGQPLKWLAITDEYTRECLAHERA